MALARRYGGCWGGPASRRWRSRTTTGSWSIPSSRPSVVTVLGGVVLVVSGMEIEEEPQPHSGLAGFPDGALRRGDRSLRGEQFLDGERSCVVQGSDLHHGQARPRHVSLVD